MPKLKQKTLSILYNRSKNDHASSFLSLLKEVLINLGIWTNVRIMYRLRTFKIF